VHSWLFFNNCVFGDISIETLASRLNDYIAGLHYTDGSPVTQVDLVTHSMGGLIARAYLAGLQSGGSFAPPANTRVRKLIEIATPNFGSFLAPNIGVQTSEMYPGSTFLWSLGTWNQGGDDLRGVDAIAVVGNGDAPLLEYPPANASDGVVTVTSASLGFARDLSRTRVLRYCHTESSVIDCNGSGIANVDHAPETGRIVKSFLADTADWTGIGIPAAQDSYLGQYGGIYFALANAAGQYQNDMTQVQWGSVALHNGGASHAV